LESVATLWRRHLYLVTLLVLIASPVVVGAQTGIVAVDQENFRVSPAGTIVAEVMAGTSLSLGESHERWRQATLEGWIWAASVREDRRDGHDLVVAPSDGENLRAEPNGEVVARLRAGMLLDRVERDGNWVRVRRTAWIWAPSLRANEAAAVERPAASGVATTRERAATTGVGGTGRGPREFATAGPAGMVVLTRPAGDTLGHVQQGGAVEVLAREGDWARVRMEGWTFTAAVSRGPDDEGVLRDLPSGELREDPDRFRGRLVEWAVQFIALQQAERFRTDFREGEHFILARGPGDEAGFIYLAITEEWLDQARRLAPLQRIRVLGRVRTAMSTLTEAPVVDLLDILERSAREP
jgi:hypothetical protein